MVCVAFHSSGVRQRRGQGRRRAARLPHAHCRDWCVSPSVHLSVCLSFSVSLSVCKSVSVSMSDCVFLCLCLCLCLCLYLCLRLCLCLCLYSVSVSVSVCVSVFLSSALSLIFFTTDDGMVLLHALGSYEAAALSVAPLVPGFSNIV
jgi:hypothetical protein